MTIFEAAENGKLKELKKLISDGADVNAKNEYGNTALIYAACCGHNDCLSALIVAGADVNAKNDDGNTALTLAAGNGHKDCVAALIAAGADVNAKNNNGWTALILAAWNGHKGCVKLLEQAQRDLEAKKAQVPEIKQSDFSQSLTKTLEELGTMLLSKNASYGNAALEPLRIFSKADSVEQLKVRIDDKLSRLQRGSDIGEDTVKDLTGYLILFLMARAKNEN